MCYVHTIVSLKSAHEWSTLQVCQRGGWVFFRVFPHLTKKECPCHIYSDLMPSKQIIGQAITHNGATSSFEVCTQHSEPHHVTMTMQCSSMCVATLSTCTTHNCRIINLQWSTRWSFLPQMCTPLEAVQILYKKLGQMWALFCVTMVYILCLVCS